MMVFSYWKLNALQSPFLCVQCGGQSPFTHPELRHSLWNSQNTTSAGMGGNTSLDSSKEAASSESKGRWILPDHVRWCSCLTFISKSWDAGGKLKLQVALILTWVHTQIYKVLQNLKKQSPSHLQVVLCVSSKSLHHLPPDNLSFLCFYSSQMLEVSTAAGLQVTETVCL